MQLASQLIKVVTHLVMLDCWIARLRCKLCTADDCRGSPKTHSLQDETTKSISISVLATSRAVVSRHSKTGCNLRRGMIVINVQPVEQVIYFFFISLKLCNTEQYRMWHWRRLSLSHLWISAHSSSSGIFQTSLINTEW